jgi:hypothetical protein
MYNRQILADHFKGLRPADDPIVQREIEMLKLQAIADWNDMSRHCRFPDVLDERTTLESIAEDYLYNVRHLAETQLSIARAKRIAGLVGLAIIAVIAWLRH